MKELLLVVKEQFANFGIIKRMSRYESKANFQNHYLGMLWEIINPLLQVGTNFLIFGVGIAGNRNVGTVPFFTWMIIGMSCWMFMNASIMGTARSVRQNVGLVSKMKFPVSTLPSINIARNLPDFFVMITLSVIAVIASGFFPNLYWVQLIYYFISMVAFMFVLGLLNSTITVLFVDYQHILSSALRLLMFFSGVVWNVETINFPEWFRSLLRLNPIFYIINGFRESLIYRRFFLTEHMNITLFFWGLVLLTGIIGAHLHLKFRDKFTDLVK